MNLNWKGRFYEGQQGNAGHKSRALIKQGLRLPWILEYPHWPLTGLIGLPVMMFMVGGQGRNRTTVIRILVGEITL